MRIYHTRPPHPTPFNFLNGMGMRIVLNKRGRVRSRTHPVAIPRYDLEKACDLNTNDPFPTHNRLKWESKGHFVVLLDRNTIAVLINACMHAWPFISDYSYIHKVEFCRIYMMGR